MTIRKILFCCSILYLNLSFPMIAGEVSVASASNFKSTLQKLIIVFEKTTGHQINISVASTGKLFTQINHNAPFEVFLAADSNTPKKLEQLSLAVNGTRFTYATGKLVLWSPKECFRYGRISLQEMQFSRLAIGNPKVVPYGFAAKQLLQQLNLWEGYQNRLIRGHNIGQTFQFVASGNTEVGLVALSQVIDWQEKSDNYKGSLWEIPYDLYSPIRQQAVLLKRGNNNLAAREFITFLKQDVAKSIIKESGYEVDDD